VGVGRRPLPAPTGLAGVGWARHDDDVGQRLGGSDAGSGPVIVTVAAPTKPVATDPSSAQSTVATSLQLVILNGG
jgi:hypothetical protein